jgi:mono/diheme cytochrome c family protein
MAVAAIAGGFVAHADGAAAQEDGAAVFGQLCQGCHTIGGGRTAGPDLQGLADRRERSWVERFILAPDEVIASGDPIAKDLLAEYGVPMPNLGVTQAQVDALLPFLGFEDAVPAPAPEPAPTPAPEPAPTEADADRGKSLFTGAEDFSAGGPSCLSCHSVAGVGSLGGGRLGPDLTDVFEKYGGEQGLRAALKGVPFPTMAPIFTRKPLTPTEQADLVAFLETAPDQARPSRAAGKLVGFSVGGAALLVALGVIVWGRRLAPVRRQLVGSSRGE